MTCLTDLPVLPRLADLAVASPQSRFAQDPEVMSSPSPSGLRLFHAGSGAIVTLDADAARVWSALDEGRSATIPDLTALLAPHADVWHIPTRRFVYALLMELQRCQFVYHPLTLDLRELMDQVMADDDDAPLIPACWPVLG